MRRSIIVLSFVGVMVVRLASPIFAQDQSERRVPDPAGLVCRVGFTVLSDGSVVDVHVVQSSGYVEMDASAVRAVQKYRFTASPGAPPRKGVILFRFKLKPDTPPNELVPYPQPER